MDDDGFDARLHDLPVDGLARAYRDRGLDRLTDAELVAAVAAVVARPRRDPADSFVLHAPLELTARARLLERTPPELQEAGRLRLLSIAARYQTHDPLDRAEASTDGPVVPDGDDPVGAVIAAVGAGDLVATDEATRALVAAGSRDGLPSDAVGRLAQAIAPSTAAAAHGPIFLATLTEVPERAAGWLAMLRPLARELARHPDWRLGWIDRVRATAGRSAELAPGGLFQALADPPRLGVPGSTFIHPTLMQVDAPGVADEILGPLVDHHETGADAARALTRVAALAMVRDTPEHGPYGWTHCLTLPLAVLTLAPQLDRLGVPALAIAATHVLGFRASLATEVLDHDDELVRRADPATEAGRRRHLVVEAALRHDAHIAKYVLASLTAADADPEAAHLHLTSAEHLLAVWDDDHGGPGIDPDDILAGDAARWRALAADLAPQVR